MIFVLMATLNGAGTLSETLERLTRVVPPRGGWEMIAVNNGSTDGSGDILASYRDHLPLTVLFEPRLGKNIALNRALDELGPRGAEADLIVFCDDDILPDPDWLCRLADAAKSHPFADMFGGTIYPHWTSAVPQSIRDLECYYGTLFSITKCAEGPCAAKDLFGPNMAVRGRVLRSGVRFDPQIGPNGADIYPMGSETEFVERLESKGHRAYFVAGARVGHLIQEAQFETEWVRLRAYRAGLGYAVRGRWKRDKPIIAGVPVKLLLSWAKSRVIVWWSRLAGRRDRIRIGRFRVSWHRGVFDGIAGRHPGAGRNDVRRRLVVQ